MKHMHKYIFDYIINFQKPHSIYSHPFPTVSVSTSLKKLFSNSHTPLPCSMMKCSLTQLGEIQLGIYYFTTCQAINTLLSIQLCTNSAQISRVYSSHIYITHTVSLLAYFICILTSSWSSVLAFFAMRNSVIFWLSLMAAMMSAVCPNCAGANEGTSVWELPMCMIISEKGYYMALHKMFSIVYVDRTAFLLHYMTWQCRWLSLYDIHRSRGYSWAVIQQKIEKPC